MRKNRFDDMASHTSDERRRQQNRESQQRYRKRQRTKAKDRIFDFDDSSQFSLPADQVWTLSDSSASMSWAHREDGIGELISPPQPGNKVMTPSYTRESLDSTAHQYVDAQPLPPTDILASRVRSSESDSPGTNIDPALHSTKYLNSRRHEPVFNVPISRYGPLASPISLPLSTESYDAQVAWMTSTPRSHETLSPESHILPPKKHHHRHDQRSNNSKHISRTETRKPQPAPRTNSKAVEMIIGVEKLYEFGVSTGILPQDRDTRLSLRRMKLRFMSLLPPASAADLDSSMEESSEEDNGR